MNTNEPITTSARRKIVLIPGMWHGGWCWEDTRRLLERHGFEGEPLELPQHGSRFTNVKKLRWLSIQACVDDLVEQLGRLDEVPVLIGHSLGCLIAECALARLEKLPPAVVLIAPTRHSVFRHSVWDFAVRRRHFLRLIELTLKRSMWPPICNTALCREMLFPGTMSDQEVESYRIHMKDASFWTACELLMGLGPKPLPQPGLPIRVIGGGKDKTVRKADVERVAEFYGTRAKIYEEMPHDMMFAPAWDAVVEEIAEWLEKHAAWTIADNQQPVS